MRKFISKLIRSFKKQPKTKIQPLSVEERKKAMVILEAVELPPEDIEKIQEMLAQKSEVDLEIVVDQFVSIATRMLSEDVDDEYIRLCYNWEE